LLLVEHQDATEPISTLYVNERQVSWFLWALQQSRTLWGGMVYYINP